MAETPWKQSHDNIKTSTSIEKGVMDVKEQRTKSEEKYVQKTAKLDSVPVHYK